MPDVNQPTGKPAGKKRTIAGQCLRNAVREWLSTVLGVVLALAAVACVWTGKAQWEQVTLPLGIAVALIVGKDHWIKNVFTRGGGAAVLAVALPLAAGSCAYRSKDRRTETVLQTRTEAQSSQAVSRTDCTTVRPLALTVARDSVRTGQLDSLRGALEELKLRGMEPVIVYRNVAGKLDLTFYLDSLNRMRAQCTSQEQSLALQLEQKVRALDSTSRLLAASQTQTRQMDVLQVKAGAHVPWWAWLVLGLMALVLLWLGLRLLMPLLGRFIPTKDPYN